MLSLFIIASSLIHITICTIYNVTPDDTACHHCHNLQHYLLNTTKYFTSNTQLLFLPGLHHLHTNLIIQNVHNISLIGSTTNGTTPDTVIQCDSSVGIVMNNITSLMMKNLAIQKCSVKYGSSKTAILVKHCSFVELHFVYIITKAGKTLSLVAVNILGRSHLSHVSCNGIYLRYTESDVMASISHVILVDHFNLIDKTSAKYGINVSFEQHRFRILLQISNIVIHRLQRYNFLHATSNSQINQSTIAIFHCQIKDTVSRYKSTLVKLFHVVNISVHLSKCSFFNNTVFKGVITAINSIYLTVDHSTFHSNLVSVLGRSDQGLITTNNVSNLQIHNCCFYNNAGETILANPTNQYIFPDHIITTAIIQNTTFSASLIPPILAIFNFIEISGTRLLLIGPVIFNNINDGVGDGFILAMANSIIAVSRYVEFSHNDVFGIVMYRCTVELDRCFMMNINDSTILNITSNTMQTFSSIEVTKHLFRKPFYPPCFFQYLSNNDQIKSNQVLVIFNGNNYEVVELSYHQVLHELVNRFVLLFSFYYIHITHCYWLAHSAVNTTIPMEINKQVIQYTNNSKLKLTKGKTLCYCVDKTHYDCFKEELGPIYPGQTLIVPLYAHLNFTFTTNIIAEKRNETYITSCRVSRPPELIQNIGKNCTLLQYTIEFPTDKWCELFLKVPQDRFMEYSIFYISQLKCPLGFVKSNGTCQCHPMFTRFGFIKCDINRQAILRPLNGWIYLLHNKSHSYYISQKCSLSYCLPYSEYVYLSTPDMQCQSNRTGLLCGRCQNGVSTIFGSNQCKKCSNIFLLLLIPFIIAGILIIVLLFLLNLTVNNGLVNPYIMYFNIISINGALLFPKFDLFIQLFLWLTLIWD